MPVTILPFWSTVFRDGPIPARCTWSNFVAAKSYTRHHHPARKRLQKLVSSHAGKLPRKKDLALFGEMDSAPDIFNVSRKRHALSAYSPRLSATSTASLVDENADLFGPPVPVYAWSIDGYFDRYQNDDFNFGLGENILGVLISIVTGLTLLLFTDIISRLIVRARTYQISTGMLYRSHVLASASNPLSVPLAVPRLLRKLKNVLAGATSEEKNKDQPRNCSENSTTTETKPISSLHLGFVQFIGSILWISKIGVIVIALNRRSNVWIDKSKMPSFAPHYSMTREIFKTNTIGCPNFPLVNRNGFESLARVHFCTGNRVEPTSGVDATNTASVTVSRSGRRIFFWTSTTSVSIRAFPTVQVKVDNRDFFLTSGVPTLEQSLSTVKDTLTKWNLNFTLVKEIYSNVSNFVQPSWQYVVQIDLNNFKMPQNIVIELIELDLLFFKPGQNESVPIKQYLWGVFLNSVLYTTLETTGTSIARQEGEKGARLSNYPGPLVIKRRPWLSLGGSIIVMSALIAIWVSILRIFGWRAGVDYSYSLTDLMIRAL